MRSLIVIDEPLADLPVRQRLVRAEGDEAIDRLGLGLEPLVEQLEDLPDGAGTGVVRDEHQDPFARVVVLCEELAHGLTRLALIHGTVFILTFDNHVLPTSRSTVPPVAQAPGRAVLTGNVLTFTDLSLTLYGHRRDHNRAGVTTVAGPAPYGTVTVLGSHSCVALSPATVQSLYQNPSVALKR